MTTVQPGGLDRIIERLWNVIIRKVDSHFVSSHQSQVKNHLHYFNRNLNISPTVFKEVRHAGDVRGVRETANTHTQGSRRLEDRFSILIWGKQP